VKILLLHSYNIFQINNASSNRWRSIVEGLTKYGVNIEFIILSGYESPEECRNFGVSGIINNTLHYHYISSQRRFGYWRTRINMYLLNRFFCAINAYRVRKIVTSIKPDIVFLYPALDVFMTYSMSLSKRDSEFKLMIELNEFNDIWDTGATNVIQRMNIKSYNHYLKNMVFPKLDICLVMTETLLTHFSTFQGLKPGITFYKIPMTVDLSRFRVVDTKEKYRKPYIAYCGSGGFLSNGIDILLKSFSQISKEYPELKLYIAAYWGKETEIMKSLINDLGLEGRAIYLGVLKRERIPDFLAGAELLTLPRPDSRQAQGGFPTKLGEYLASSKPVCVTDVGEIANYLKDNESAFFAEPGSIDSFSHALRSALCNKERANAVGINGRKVAEVHFNMESQMKRLYLFLKENLKCN